MEALLQWELNFIRAVQSFANPGLTALMKAVTNFGAAPAYMLLLPLCYWCIDEKKGIRLNFAVMGAVWMNLTLKFFCKQPRPFWPAYDPSVGLIQEPLYGLPSGHAQISMTMWTIVASWFKKRWVFCVAAAIILLVGFSRIYLGVHFPTDLVVGWLLGVVVLVIYFAFEEKIAAVLSAGGMRLQFIVAAAASLVMILYNPESAKEMPNAVQSLVMPGGVVLGLGIGYSLNINYVHFRASKVFERKGAAKCFTLFARLLLGMIGVVLVFVVFSLVRRALGIGEASSFYRLCVFLQFAALEIWMCTGAPWVFQRLYLAEKG